MTYFLRRCWTIVCAGRGRLVGGLAVVLWGLLGAAGLTQNARTLDDASASYLPSLGEDGIMSTAAERRLGDLIARDLYRDPAYLDDPVLSDYVQRIWQRLLAAARLRGDVLAEFDAHFAWDVLLLRDRRVNAFAAPAGYLGLNLGLIAVVNSADELSAVLAHELSHVTQRHVVRMVARQTQQTPWLIGGMILAVLAAGKSPDAGSALMAGSQAAMVQSQLNFSRDMERQADRMGFGVMTQAGFAAAGFVTMFEKLQQAAGLNDNGSYPYLRSHPLTTERMADMQGRVGLTTAPALPPTTPEHAMLVARAIVLTQVAQAAALRSHLQQASAPDAAARSGAQQAGLFYAAALAAMQLRDGAGAQWWLARLRALPELADQTAAPARLAAYLAVELALAQGDVASAQRHLQALQNSLGMSAAALAANRMAPSDLPRPALMLWAEVAWRAGAAAELRLVSSALSRWVLLHPRDALAWQWLARANTALGLPLQSLRAQAEVQAAYLDDPGALDRLLAAQALLRGAKLTPADAVEAAIVDVRRRQIESRLQENALQR